MGEIGKVIKVNENKITVELERKEACAKCRACSVGMKSETMVIECFNSCEAKLNEKVEIVLEEKNFIQAVLIMYGIPFVFFVVGLSAGYYISNMLNISAKEIIGFCSGIVFVMISYLWIRANEHHWKNKKFIPTAIKIVEE